MSAEDEGGRDPLKPKGKTLGSFLESLPGFSSARNLMAGAQGSAREARPVADPTGASTQPQAQAATNPEQTASGDKLSPPSDKVISGAKDLVYSKMTKTKDAISSGVATMVDTAKGVVQGGLGVTRSAFTGTKEAVASGVTGAVGVAKGAVQGGLDTSKAVLTGAKDTVSTGLTGALGMAKGTVQTGVDTTKTVMTGTKDTVSSGVTGAVNVAKGAIQTGVDTSKAVLTGTKDTVSAGLTGALGMAKGTIQTGMDTTKTVLTGTKDTVSTGLTGALGMAKGTVQTGVDTTKTVLTGTKDTVSSGVTGAVNVTKGAVQTGVDTSKAVLTGTRDTVSAGLMGAVNTAKGAVQTGLNTTQNIASGTKNTICAGVTGAVNVAKGAVQRGLDTSKNVLTGTKDTVSAGLTGALGMAKCTVQTGMDTSKAVLTGTRDTVSTGLMQAGNVAKGAMQTGVGTIQNWLPCTQDTVWGGPSSGAVDVGGQQTALTSPEALSSGVSRSPDTVCAGLHLAGEAGSGAKGFEPAATTLSQAAPLGRGDAGHVATTPGQEGAMGFVMLQDELEGLGDIFHPMDAEEQAQLAASEPGPRVLTADRASYFVRLGDVAPRFRQRAFEHSLSHLQHSQFQARATLAQLEDSFGLVPDAGALSRACGLLQQLHVACSTLAYSLQGLPAELQQQVGRVRQSICELYGVMSSAGSAAELPAERLAQARDSLGRAWEGLERTLEGVQHQPPLSWLVGPFALAPGGQQL